MSGCSGGQRRNDGGRADLEHHARYQLPGQSVEEGVAERGQLDHQGKHEPTEAAVLGCSSGRYYRNSKSWLAGKHRTVSFIREPIHPTNPKPNVISASSRGESH